VKVLEEGKVRMRRSLSALSVTTLTLSLLLLLLSAGMVSVHTTEVPNVSPLSRHNCEECPEKPFGDGKCLERGARRKGKN
jgi:hypothetical protein